MLGSIGQYRLRPASNKNVSWYLVRIATPKIIHVAARELRNFPIWIPSTLFVSNTYKKQVIKYSPVWPEYILVGISGADKLAELDNILKESSVFDPGFVPTKISKDTVKELDSRCACPMSPIKQTFYVGQTVELSSGPLTGVPGTIIACKGKWLEMSLIIGHIEYYIKIVKNRATSLVNITV